MNALSDVVQSQLMTSDGWRYRRMLVFAIIGFMCGLIAWLSWKDSPSTLAAMSMQGAFTAIETLAPAYVFAAMWDDRNKRKHAFTSGQPAEPDEAPEHP